MTQMAFNSDTLLRQINDLDRKRRLLFGASCCERLLPNYVTFKNDTGWGNVAPLRSALDVIWSSVAGESHSNKDILDMISACEDVAPDSDNFTSLYVSFAQDACFSICGMLDFLSGSDSEKVVQAATYAVSSVDLFVQEIENMDSTDPNLEDKILHHPLMQQELEKQQADIKSLALAPVIDAGFLAEIRNSSSINGKSNLELSI
jgi:uncharacterized protein